MVMTIKGAVVPGASLTSAAFTMFLLLLTCPETPEAFSSVSVLDAVPTILEIFPVTVSRCHGLYIVVLITIACVS